MLKTENTENTRFRRRGRKGAGANLSALVARQENVRGEASKGFPFICCKEICQPRFFL